MGLKYELLKNLLWKISLTVENFFDQTYCGEFSCGKPPWSHILCKIILTVEKVLDQIFSRKLPWSIFVENSVDEIFFWKVTWTAKKFLDQQKLSLLWKSFLIRKISLTVENFLLSWLQKIIGLIIFKPLRPIFLMLYLFNICANSVLRFMTTTKTNVYS